MEHTQQINLFPVITPVEYLPEETLDQRFQKWLQLNPGVLRVFVHFAREAQRRGAKKIGAKALIERMRWQWIGTTTGDDFRLNNSFTSRLARRAVEVDPSLRDLFEFRELRS